MNSYLALLIGAYLALANQPNGDLSLRLGSQSEWESFKLEHSKSYESQHVESLRRTMFTHNKNKVDQFNRDQADELGFSLKINHLADLSDIEYSATNGFKLPAEVEARREMLRNSVESQKFLDDILNDDSIEVPDELDWRKTAGRVTRVKNQGSCGSCWAFSATGALEGQEKVRKFNNKSIDTDQDVIELSEQNLVDCVKDDYGCNGGLMADAFNFIKSEQGIDDENSYPYKARTQKCQFKKDKVAFTDSGAAILPAGDEQKLKEMLAKFGPISVAIDASSLWFQFYHKGVYYNRHCKNKNNQLDHGVLAVGYGTDPKQGDYWIVKNSWGPKWGQKGYILMARNKKNNCGIATVATVPTFSN